MDEFVPPLTLGLGILAGLSYVVNARVQSLAEEFDKVAADTIKILGERNADLSKFAFE